MLFKDYNKIQYQIGGKTITLLDIFKNISFANVDTSLAFLDYYIQDGETPEIVSARMYGTTSYSWLVLLVNAYSSVKFDWFVSAEEYSRFTEDNFGGDAAYISALPDIQQGDIFVKVTAYSDNTATTVNTSAYRHIAEFDPYYRRIRGISGGGTFESGDLILFARRNGENGTVTPIQFGNTASDENRQLTDFTELIFIEPFENSISYLYDSNNVIIDPYKTSVSGITSINSYTLYSNPGDTLTVNNFASSIIYKYGKSGGPPETGLFKKTIGEGEYDKYIKKQKIRVLKSDYLPSILSAIETALASNEIGKKFTVEI
jgi:hypothetical protein